MKTFSAISIISAALLVTIVVLLSAHYIISSRELAEAPVSVELPTDEIEIHCEIMKPA